MCVFIVREISLFVLFYIERVGIAETRGFEKFEKSRYGHRVVRVDTRIFPFFFSIRDPFAVGSAAGHGTLDKTHTANTDRRRASVYRTWCAAVGSPCVYPA